jgi:broad specificity phosphatase PhoE
MTRLLLVRHGQSVWNADGRWQGQADPPLSELGRTQAFHAAHRVGSIDVIVASDLERARDTALIISEAIGVGPVIVEPGLRERDAGEWSGLTRSEIDERWPGYLDERRRPPGWESDESVLSRLHGVLGRIEDEYAGAEVLVVTHGGVVYALEAEHEVEWARLANLGARQVEMDGGRITLGDRIALVDHDELTIPNQI